MTTAAPHSAEPASAKGQHSPLLEIEDLAVSFGEGDSIHRVVDQLRLAVHTGQTVAVVGESGSGKSMTALSILGLVPPGGRVDRGAIRFGGRDLLSLPQRETLALRGGEIAMIFQEPMTSLNPVLTVGEQILEAVLLHRPLSRREAEQVVVASLREVGIPQPEARLSAYPHEFSGGMRQRVMIAMALVCRPKLLLADEPTTALDVTIQAQILELLRSIQRARGLGILLITHDLGVVASSADVVCVMHGGHVLETARVETLFDRPLHPYTRGLMRSIPRLGDRRRRLVTVDEIVGNEAEFYPVGVGALRATPWWVPENHPNHERARAEYALVEAEPEHWVGCAAAPDHPAARFPRIAYRRRSE